MRNLKDTIKTVNACNHWQYDFLKHIEPNVDKLMFKVDGSLTKKAAAIFTEWQAEKPLVCAGLHHYYVYVENTYNGVGCFTTNAIKFRFKYSLASHIGNAIYNEDFHRFDYPLDLPVSIDEAVDIQTMVDENHKAREQIYKLESIILNNKSLAKKIGITL